jgi:hypothetical protein
MIDSSYGYELRLRQKYSLCWFQMTNSKFQIVTSRGPVTAGSKCEVTVITGYRSTQDDEHLCGKTVTEPVVGLQVLEKARLHTLGTYMYSVIRNYVTKKRDT